jgi:predicted small secreted protein
MRRQLAAALVMLGLVAMPLLTACNTTAGAGQDLQAAGRGLENSADRNAPYRP